MPDWNIIFDLDGTLVDSSLGVVEATNYALEQMGQPRREYAEIARYIGYPLDVMFADFTDVSFEALASHFQVKARETVVASTRPLPAAHETVVSLHSRHYRLAIATTKIRIHVDLILYKCDWGRYFAATVGGDEVQSVKPAPDAFLLALKRLGATPQAAIVVGDTINDVLAAKAAGLPVVAISSPFGRDGELESSGADYHIKSITELPDLVRVHFGRPRTAR